MVTNKTRLFAQGFTQDENDAKLEAIRMLLAYVAHHNFKLYQMDVKSAFLNSPIQELVYVEKPPSFKDPKFSNHVYKLQKTLYGLKQAPRAWYECLKEFLLKQGFEIGIPHHLLRDHETKGDIKIHHMSTEKQLADIFTKPVDESRFCALRSELNILDSHNVV